MSAERIHRRLLLITAAAGLAAGLVAATGVPAMAEPASPSWCAATGTLSASKIPHRITPSQCKLAGRTIRATHIGAVVPPRGQTVSADALLTNGSEELTLSTSSDGTVTTSIGLEQPKVAKLASPPACSDTAYTREPWKWTTNGTYTWYYNSTNDTYSVLTHADALAAVRNATSNIVVGYNDCGYTGKPNIYQSYAGTTTTGVNITTAGSCGTTDSYNISQWLGMSVSGLLGLTCTWYNSSTHIAAYSDMALNYNFSWWNGSGSCSGYYDAQSVATHERGHTFGLDHVDPSTHYYETMTTTMPSCDSSKRTLAAGDQGGLTATYGYH